MIILSYYDIFFFQYSCDDVIIVLFIAQPGMGMHMYTIITVNKTKYIIL